MAEYKVEYRGYVDVFTSIDAARRKNNNRWKGKGQIYIKRKDGWEPIK